MAKSMKFKIAFACVMISSAAALADPKDLDPNAHPLPPQAIGSNAPGAPVPATPPPPRMAANAPAPSATSTLPSGPCIRGQSAVRMGGADVDELKCELAVVRMERAAAQERLEKILAAGSLVSSDLATARQHESALAEWFKG